MESVIASKLQALNAEGEEDGSADYSTLSKEFKVHIIQQDVGKIGHVLYWFYCARMTDDARTEIWIPESQASVQVLQTLYPDLHPFHTNLSYTLLD